MANLEYESLNDCHVNELLPIWADEDVIRFTSIKAPCTLAEIRDRINILKQYDVFVVKNYDSVIGVIGCPCIDKSKSQYGMFYHFSKSSWGKGYATAVTEWLLQFMKKKYNNITLYAEVVANNVASEKILKHFGFSLISEEDDFKQDGIKLETRNYMLKIF